MDKKIECPKCQSTDIVKNGIVRGTQRYKCKHCRYNFVLTDKRTSREVTILKAISTLVNALNDIPYDELEVLLNRDRSLLHRWNTASEMREHRPKRLDSSKIAYNNLENVVDPDLIDCYIYELNSVQMRYKFLLARIKKLELG